MKFLILAIVALSAMLSVDCRKSSLLLDLEKISEATNLPIPRNSPVSQIDQYGCWCYLSSNFRLGKSAPVDEIDQLCKEMADGYGCAIIDDQTCNEPWSETYNSAVQTVFMNPSLSIIDQCQFLNQGSTDCAIRACIIQGSFNLQIFNRFFAGTLIVNQSFKHSNGFDINATCQTINKTPSEKSCCGDYPNRFPFKNFGGVRQCCGGKVVTGSC